MLVEDLRFHNNLFRSCALFQEKKKKIEWHLINPKTKSRQGYLISISYYN